MEYIVSAITDWVNANIFLLRIISWIILCVGFLYNLILLTYIPLAWKELRLHGQGKDAQTSWDPQMFTASLPVTVIVPAYNESLNIMETVSSLLTLHYPNFELVVVNDGSTDTMMELLTEKFALKPSARTSDDTKLKFAPVKNVHESQIYPALYVVDKENGGRADAINAGISCTRTPPVLHH